LAFFGSGMFLLVAGLTDFGDLRRYWGQKKAVAAVGALKPQPPNRPRGPGAGRAGGSAMPVGTIARKTSDPTDKSKAKALGT
jgi:hypothetical protein